MSERRRRRLRENHGWIRPRSGEIMLNASLKVAQRRGVDVELPLQVGAHLSFHLIDLAERKHALSNDAPRLVGICIVTYDLGGEHKRRNK